MELRRQCFDDHKQCALLSNTVIHLLLIDVAASAAIAFHRLASVLVCIEFSFAMLHVA